MLLSEGTRLGPYEITSLLGQGGMGEVYKARDTRLNRTVAIKVLRDRDPRLRERFARESHAIAALQHPHICTIHDVGSHDGLDYIVMEHLDGQPLKGPLPAGKVIEYGIQIADALDAAHRQGITHRDLKPANIVATRTGAKVLDFGIARISGDATMTQTGAIVGTPAYMAPEQWTGQAADARTDIYALGNVLKELATGRLDASKPIQPSALEWLIGKCLNRDPEERFQSARDVRLLLESIRDAPTMPGPVVRQPARRALFTTGLLVIVAAIGAGIGWLVKRTPPPALMQLAIAPPPESPFIMEGNYEGGIALSPDGTMLAFVARTRNRPQLWIRRLDAGSATPLPGTEDAYLPFWSPDSKQIAFYTPDQLKKVPIGGGPVQTLCRTDPRANGGAWMSDDVLVIGGRPGFGLHRISATGGDSQRLVDGSWPHPLPDGRRFLYSTSDGIWVGSVAADQEPRRIFDASTSQVLYSLGHLLFVRDRTLVAHRLDPDTLEVSPAAIVIAPSLLASVYRATVSATADGVLVYAAGDLLNRLRWRDRDGNLLGDLGEPAQYAMPRISPDGTRVAFARTDGTNTDIWIATPGRPPAARLTLGEDADQFPVWSPDGRSIAFASGPGQMADLFRKPADGTGRTERLTNEISRQHAMDWSTDGHFLSFTRNSLGYGTDLLILPTGGDRKPYVFWQTKVSEAHSQFRPGVPARWMAYSSDDVGGRREVFVTEFTPGQTAGARWQVSTDGGTMPRWRADGRELYYWALDGRIMAVDVVVEGSALRTGAPRKLFQVDPPTLRTNAIQFDADPRGQRFLLVEPSEQLKFQPLTFVSNWLAAALRR